LELGEEEYPERRKNRAPQEGKRRGLRSRLGLGLVE